MPNAANEHDYCERRSKAAPVHQVRQDHFNFVINMRQIFLKFFGKTSGILKLLSRGRLEL